MKKSEKIKVIFLDIDGVVNCQSTNFKTDYWPIDRYMAFLVGKIVLDTGCKVVLSSSWRHHPDGIKTVEKHIVPVFDTTGDEPYDNSRPPGAENCERGREIKAWLDQHPEVEKYAIVDDNSDMLPEQKSNFFKTTWLNGLTEDIAKEITNHLK